MSDTNQAVQSQNKATSLKLWIYVEKELFYPCGKNKGSDQLCSYCTSASLFLHMQTVCFLMQRLKCLALKDPTQGPNTPPVGFENQGPLY